MDTLTPPQAPPQDTQATAPPNVPTNTGIPKVGDPIPADATFTPPTPTQPKVGDPIPADATFDPPDPEQAVGPVRFVEHGYSSSGAKNLVDMVSGQAESFYKSTKPTSAMDLYNGAVEAGKSGDWKTAAKLAAQLTFNAPSFGITDPDSPILKAAEALIMHPVESIMKQQEENKKGGTLLDDYNKYTSDVQSDLKNRDPISAIVDAFAEPMSSNAAGMVPLVGGAIQQEGDALRQDAHKKDYWGLAGDIAGPLATLGISKVLGTLGEGGPPGGGGGGGVTSAEAADQLSKAAQKTNSIPDIIADAEKAKQQIHDNFDQAEATAAKAKQDAIDQAAKERDTNIRQSRIQGRQEKNSIDAEKEAARQKALNSRRDALDTGKTDIRGVKSDATAQAGEVSDTLAQALQDAQDSEAQANSHVQTGLEQSRKDIDQNFGDSLKQIAPDAPAKEELAPIINKALTTADETSHTDYEAGITGPQGIQTRLAGETAPTVGGALQKTAQEKLDQPLPADHTYEAGARNVAGEKLDGGVKKLLEQMADGREPVEDVEGVQGKEGAEGPAQLPPALPDLNIRQLINIRQLLRRKMASFVRGDLNRSVLNDIIGAVDDEIGGMARRAKDPTALRDYEALRTTYRTRRAVLDSDTADKLKLTDPDSALQNANDFLLGGGNVPAKLATMRAAAGDGLMDTLANAKVKQWSQMSPADVIKEYEGMDPVIREHFFGKDLNERLQNAVNLHKDSMDYANSYADQTRGFNANTRREATIGARQLGRAQAQRIAGASSDEINSIRDRYTSAARAAQDEFNRAAQEARLKKQEISQNVTDEISGHRETYTQAERAAKEKYDAEAAARNKARDEALQPFSTKLMKDINEGTVTKGIANGKYSVSDIRGLKSILEPLGKWNDFRDGVISRAAADAMTSGQFDPFKFAGWMKDIDPAIKDELFSLNDPANATKFADVINKVTDTQAKQAALRYLLKSGIQVGSSAVGALLGDKLAGSLGFGMRTAVDVMAALATMTTTGHYVVPMVGKVLDTISQHPAVWRTIDAATNAAKTASHAAGTVAARAPYVSNINGSAPRYVDHSISETMVDRNPKGLVEPGNLPIWNRPVVHNADGSHSSELSFSRENNGKEVLVPSIVNGKFMTPDGKMPPLGKEVNGKYVPTLQEKAMQDKAWQHYERTGENLGKFSNPDDADAYAERLHNRGSRGDSLRKALSAARALGG